MRQRQKLETSAPSNLASALAIFECDNSGKVIYANQECLDLLDQSATVIVGKALSDIFLPASSHVPSEFKKHLRDGAPWRTTCLLKQDSTKKLSLLLTPHYSQGKRLGSFGQLMPAHQVPTNQISSIWQRLPLMPTLIGASGLAVMALWWLHLSAAESSNLQTGIVVAVSALLLSIPFLVSQLLIKPIESLRQAVHQKQLFPNTPMAMMEPATEPLKEFDDSLLAFIQSEAVRNLQRHSDSGANEQMRQGLECVSSCLMMVNEQFDIVYLNQSVRSLLKKHEPRIQSVLPHFVCDRLVGTNIDTFHKNPHHQRSLLSALNAAYRSEIQIADLTFTLTANAIRDAQGKRKGAVVEWHDRTDEVRVEREIQSVVQAVCAGQLSKRLTLNDKEGFSLTLCKEINAMVDSIADCFDDIAQTVNAMAHGDLTYHMQGEREGHFGHIQNNINQALQQFHETVSDITKASQFFQRNSEEIAQGNGDLSDRTEKQAATLQATAASMEQLSSTIHSNADAAQQANELASASTHTAQKGEEILTDTIAAMQDIEHSSQRIAEIVGLIDTIAFQTHMLALNASVEAAKAGEHGSGFAVVATEVRSLASRSAEAAHEIKALVSAGVDKAHVGSDLVHRSGESLTQILSHVSQVDQLMSEIANASAEQSQGATQVSAAICEIDDMTQKNSALAELITKASDSASQKAQMLAERISFFHTQRTPPTWRER